MDINLWEAIAAGFTFKDSIYLAVVLEKDS
jgi:hypothetical protein